MPPNRRPSRSSGGTRPSATAGRRERSRRRPAARAGSAPVGSGRRHWPGSGCRATRPSGFMVGTTHSVIPSGSGSDRARSSTRRPPSSSPWVCTDDEDGPGPVAVADGRDRPPLRRGADLARLGRRIGRGVVGDAQVLEQGIVGHAGHRAARRRVGRRPSPVGHGARGHRSTRW